MRFEFLFAAIIVPQLIKSQTPSVALTSINPDDIVNNGVVCPSLYPVEITCVGVEVMSLMWERNGIRINVFSASDNEGDILQPDGPFTLFLDSVARQGDSQRANMTSRLVSNISNLMSGDTIICGELANTEVTVTQVLGYSLIESPPSVPTTLSVFTERDGILVDISISWDSAFNLLHNVSSYRVVASGGSAASCPSSCDPSGPCMCIGLGIGVDTTITITAVNCGDQMGTPVQVTARPRVPSRPSQCSVLPVYSSTGSLIAVDIAWIIVNNPSEFLPGVSQDVMDYFIAVGTMDPMTIPASIACPTSACFHSNYSIQLLSDFNSPLSASVSAINVIGRGEMCIPQTEIGTRNQVFSLTLDTTNIGNQTVACVLLSAEECEFCYSAGDSCQNLTCIPATETPTLLPTLTELTYCYRATASANGTAVAVIQDTFNTACPPAALGTTTDSPTDSRCSSDSMGSVSIPHGLGCYDGQRRGALTNYQCDKWYALSGGSSRTCMGDGNWDGEVPECRPNGGNIAMLVVSILLWIFSLFLTVFAAVAFKKEISLKDRRLFNFHILPLWSKIIYIVLFVIECLFLLVVLSLWISAGAIPNSPNSGSLQTSLLIAALVLALPWIASALIFLFVISECSSRKSGDNQRNKESGKSDVTIKTPSPPVYATPDISKKKNRRPETKEHKPDPDQPNVGKSKGFLVKKGKGKNKALENIELPSYDVLEGPGHHTSKPPPKAPVTADKYDVLDMKGQYYVDDHTPVNQPGVYSTIPGEADEYSQVDKKSSQKRLISQTSSDKQKS